MPLSFQTSSGKSPSTVVLELKKNLQPTAADMRYAAERQKARIIRRTNLGVDVDGAPFKEYSAGYAKRKQKSGRRATPVNLTWSGRMLKALMISRVTDRGYVLGIYNDEGVRAHAHNEGLGHQPRRHFIGASSKEKAQNISDIATSIKARVNGVTTSYVNWLASGMS
jgi:hypothetical protein